VGSDGERPAPTTLMDALGSAEEDLRRHRTCAPAAMAGLAARPLVMGDGRTARERAAQVTGTDAIGGYNRKRAQPCEEKCGR
jgi:hypothetical protein